MAKFKKPPPRVKQRAAASAPSSGTKCCWCIDANTNANIVSNYISPKYCEEAVNDPKQPFASCKKVEVEGNRCSFQVFSTRAIEDSSQRVRGTRDSRTTNLKVRGTGEVITALTPQPNHCDRQLTSTGLAPSNDPRCAAETCKCFADPNLPWNCELVLIRTDGKKESLGVRPKLEREHGCDATACRQLFAREVHAFCPSFNKDE